MKTKKDERARNWTFVLYPESVPAKWEEMLDEHGTPWVKSPLHDRCLNDDNTPKKAHWHIALLYQGKKSFEQVKELTDKLNGPIPQKINSVMGTIRYMTHMDNPEKTQYPASEIVGHCGADVAKYLKITATDRYVAIHEMISFVKENEVTEYHQLLSWAAENRHDWYTLLCDSASFVMLQFIKSYRHDVEYRQAARMLSEEV